MTRLHNVGRVLVDLDRPCRLCGHPLPLAVTADGYNTHPSCDRHHHQPTERHP